MSDKEAWALATLFRMGDLIARMTDFLDENADLLDATQRVRARAFVAESDDLLHNMKNPPADDANWLSRRQES